MGFEGGHVKKIGLQRGASRKNMVCKGRVTKQNVFKFRSDTICNNANISARRPKIAF